ncbi:hypothetical protein [Salinimicrobium sp. TH3]|uniref:hypothetical protein n=1 Tax=Salinimicrobium sp. TH3 TaxID=2997342 RepID=UPI0022743613|nr:hypothetical protein [Salinimicrobium sp. TH3]MCY2686792.1 hypothetical protein [Salinimicrobium sp. TH3]
MKKTLLLLLLLFPIILFGQAEKSIDSLNYAGIKIAVPENCIAASAYELLDCNGSTIQWLYLNQEMLKTVPEQFITQFSSQQNFKRKSDISLKSFGFDLQGVVFKIENQNRDMFKIIAYGTVNNQPLILNIGTDKRIKRTEDLSDFLQKLISVK